MDTQLDPQVIINDLLDQIKKLTLDNSMLRAYINGKMASSAPEIPIVVEDAE